VPTTNDFGLTIFKVVHYNLFFMNFFSTKFVYLSCPDSVHLHLLELKFCDIIV
jgi:hypothetical protein